jgi:hypothetical protein
MTFILSYEQDFQRFILAVINDSRSTIPAIAAQNGNAIYAYAQAQISAITPGVLVYRILGNDTNIGGYLALSVQNGVASILQLQLRPAYQPFLSEISQIINTFIQQNGFMADIIY